MNKKFTLLAAALMTVGTFTAASAASDVPSKECTGHRTKRIKRYIE